MGLHARCGARKAADRPLHLAGSARAAGRGWRRSAAFSRGPPYSGSFSRLRLLDDAAGEAAALQQLVLRLVVVVDAVAGLLLRDALEVEDVRVLLLDEELGGALVDGLGEERAQRGEGDDRREDGEDEAPAAQEDVDVVPEVGLALRRGLVRRVWGRGDGHEPFAHGPARGSPAVRSSSGRAGAPRLPVPLDATAQEFSLIGRAEQGRSLGSLRSGWASRCETGFPGVRAVFAYRAVGGSGSPDLGCPRASIRTRRGDRHRHRRGPAQPRAPRPSRPQRALTEGLRLLRELADPSAPVTAAAPRDDGRIPRPPSQPAGSG